MKFTYVLISLFSFYIISCSDTDTLTVAFTNISSIEKGSVVLHNDNPIGRVINYSVSTQRDTVFIILKINRNIKIPKDSKFYLEEKLLGPSIISVEYSNNKDLLNSNDVSIGTLITVPRIRTPQSDSLLEQLKVISLDSADYRIAAYNIPFCASWVDSLPHQLL